MKMEATTSQYGLVRVVRNGLFGLTKQESFDPNNISFTTPTQLQPNLTQL